MTDQKTQGVLKLGLVATDPLRILGLQTIFAEGGTGSKGDGALVEIVPLSVPGALDASGVSLILIDSACTDHIFELLAVFRRTRPHLRLIVLGLEEDHEYIQRIIGAGAKGYLAHTAKGTEVRLAIEIVQDGSAWAPRKVLANLLELSSAEEMRAGTVSEPKFTKREAQVLRLACRWTSKPSHRGGAWDRSGDGEEACGDADAKGWGEEPHRTVCAGGESEAAFEVVVSPADQLRVSFFMLTV